MRRHVLVWQYASAVNASVEARMPLDELATHLVTATAEQQDLAIGSIDHGRDRGDEHAANESAVRAEVADQRTRTGVACADGRRRRRIADDRNAARHGQPIDHLLHAA